MQDEILKPCDGKKPGNPVQKFGGVQPERREQYAIEVECIVITENWVRTTCVAVASSRRMLGQDAPATFMPGTWRLPASASEAGLASCKAGFALTASIAQPSDPSSGSTQQMD